MDPAHEYPLRLVSYLFSFLYSISLSTFLDNTFIAFMYYSHRHKRKERNDGDGVPRFRCDFNCDYDLCDSCYYKNRKSGTLVGGQGICKACLSFLRSTYFVQFWLLTTMVNQRSKQIFLLVTTGNAPIKLKIFQKLLFYIIYYCLKNLWPDPNRFGITDV